jgi:hypothetical protein
MQKSQLTALIKKYEPDLRVSNLQKLDLFRWSCAALVKAGFSPQSSWRNEDIHTIEDIGPTLRGLSFYNNFSKDQLSSLAYTRFLPRNAPRDELTKQLLWYDITDKQPEVVLGRGMGVGEAFRRRLTEKCMMGTGYRSEYDTDDEELGSVCSMNTADVSHVHDLGKRLFSWAEVDMWCFQDNDLDNRLLNSRIEWLDRLYDNTKPLPGIENDSPERRLHVFLRTNVRPNVRREIRLLKQCPEVRLDTWPRPLDALQLTLWNAFQLTSRPETPGPLLEKQESMAVKNIFTAGRNINVYRMRKPQVLCCFPTARHPLLPVSRSPAFLSAEKHCFQ